MKSLEWKMLLLLVCVGLQLSVIFAAQQQEGYRHYRAVPLNLDHLGGRQYFHIHITSYADTEVEITLHGTYLFRAATLSSLNDWSWHENIYISTDLTTAAYSKGFHILADNTVTILLTRNCTVSQSLLAYTAFPLSHKQNEEFIIGSYQSYTTRWKSIFLVATGDEGTTINTYGPGSTATTLSNLSIADNTVYQYLVTKPRNVIGFKVVSSAPAAVFGGNQRTYVPLNIKTPFVPVFYQIPPRERVGSEYVVGPLSDRISSGQYSVFIVFCHHDASVSITHNMGESGLTVTQSSLSSCVCDYNATTACLIGCYGNQKEGSYIELRVADAKQTILVNCSQACLVFTLFHSYAVRSHLSLGGSMALIAPPRLAPSGFHFFIPVVAGKNEIQYTRVNIAVPTLSMHGVIVDGIIIVELQKLMKYTESTVNNWTVVSLHMEPGNHRVSHEDVHIPLSVHVYGTVIPQILSVAAASTFGYPAEYPEVTELLENTTVQQPEINTEAPVVSTTSAPVQKTNYYGLQVVICILAVAVFLSVLAVILIVIRNAALLRVLLEYQQPEIPPDFVHKDPLTQVKNNEIHSVQPEACSSKHKEKGDVEMYLIPSSSRPRYVKQEVRPVTTLTSKHKATGSPPDLHKLTIPLPDLPSDQDDNYDNIDMM